MKLKKWIPFLLMFAAVFLIANQVPSVLAKDDSGNGTIAGIEIGKQKKSEMKSHIASEIVKWKEKDVEVEGTTAKVTIPSDLIHFDIDKTVEHYISASSTPWYNFWRKGKKTQVPIEVTVDEQVYELLGEIPYFYVDETVEAIREHAGFLRDGAVQAKEIPLTQEDMGRISFEIQEVVVDGHGISQIVDVLNETTILSGETFSFLEQLREVKSFFSDETANFVASTLYSAVLQSELEIQERHSQNVLPAYLQPGIEVKVNDRRKQDFSFVNRTNRPFLLTASLQEGRLKVELYSFKPAYEAAVDVRQGEAIKPRTIYRLTPSLAAGQERLLAQGEDGLSVKVYKKLTETGSPYEEDILISQDFYPPKNKVVLVSSLEPSGTPPEGNSSSTETPSTQPDGEEDDPHSNRSNNPNDQPSEHENEDELTDIEEIYDKGGNLIKPDAN